MSSADIELHVNNTRYVVDARDADMTLLDYLQERLDLTGTKFGCGMGVCRACTVGVRSAPGAVLEKTLACSTLVGAVAGMHIETVENLATNNALSDLQQRFLEHFAFQCGYCTPGFLMAATAMLDHLARHPVKAQEIDLMIDTWVGGNLCRCSGYIKYRQAIAEVALRQLRTRTRS
ncbi:MAG TPA: 2Fe-2S iron-sulfur cluster-binding protein [Pararobbsia sp.]|nr:2Fe-2S iron-sulfur cluster-binding protein [Pararobbsia sp.]